MNSAVERAIECISERYSEPLSLTEVARGAILSRFHFCRVFRDTTGVTPGRFLSAVRIYQAKRMLLTTSLSITDIAFAVGYNSLGSFSNHFTNSVGESIGRPPYVAAGGVRRPIRSASSPAEGALAGRSPSRGRGRQRVRRGLRHANRAAAARFRRPGRGFVRRPVRALSPGLRACGRGLVHAVATADSADPEPWTRRTLLVGRQGPVVVTVGSVTPASIELRARQRTDLPILLALPDLETQLDSLAPAEVEPVPVGDLVSAPLAR